MLSGAPSSYGGTMFQAPQGVGTWGGLHRCPSGHWDMKKWWLFTTIMMMRIVYNNNVI
jgi:hypothetical protein